MPSTASDEWAVDGAHSATGAPLLAGDPHLGFSMPGYWYLARIDVAGRGATPARTWAGATAPGLPFLILGRTAQIAWTFTTAQADTQDLFIETAVDASRYLTPAGAAPFVTHDETIKVRGGADRVLHVRETRHGPVISDIDASGRDGQVLAVAMTALQPNDQAAAGLDALNQAQNVPAAMRAAAMITAPVQNLLIADRRHIGLATTGEVPLRAAGDGMQPQDGAAGTFDWTGFASGARLPHYLDPPSGHLLNGNESTAGPDFPVFMGAEQIGDWRARRIRALLAGLHQATVADFVAMQNDIIDGQAVELLPLLQTAQPATALGRRALGLLSGWNGGMGRTLPQPLIYNAWMQRLRLEMLDHAGVPPSLSGQRMELLDAVLRRHDGTALLCGDDDCASLLAGTLDRAMADVAGRQGADPASWRWGRAHRAVFAHPLLARIPWLGRLFSWRIATSGDDGTLDRAAMGEGPVADYDDLHGAAFRAVYDMANPDSSEFVVTPGQSGNVLSAHATDFMRRWRDGEAVSLGPAPHDIEQTLTLQPAPVSGGH